MIIYKEKNKFEEKLISATEQEFQFLQNEIEQNPKLKKQLTTPIGKIPQYKHILGGIPNAHIYPLLSILKFIIIENRPGSKLLFSKAGDKFIGFITYIDNGKIINGLKIASFFDDKAKANQIMAKDLKYFLSEYIPKRIYIEWEVEGNHNQANELYQTAIPHWFPQYNFNWQLNKSNNRIIYRIKI